MKKTNQFNLDDIVLFRSSRGTYWSAIQEKFVKDKEKASQFEWFHARLMVNMSKTKAGKAGKWVKWS